MACGSGETRNLENREIRDMFSSSAQVLAESPPAVFPSLLLDQIGVSQHRGGCQFPNGKHVEPVCGYCGPPPNPLIVKNTDKY